MQNTIKAISFDIWNTILPSNKEYTRKRNEVIAHDLSVSYEEANFFYKKAKKFFDTCAESEGKCFSTPQCWQTLLEIANKNTCSHLHLMKKCQILFDDFIPTFNPELLIEIQKLKEAGLILCITSNTNFVAGETLKNSIFSRWNIFSGFTFSDEVLFAKPHHQIFKHTFQSVQKESPSIKPENILHIGDNLICDGGAESFGFQFQHVNNPEDFLIKLKNKTLPL